MIQVLVSLARRALALPPPPQLPPAHRPGALPAGPGSPRGSLPASPGSGEFARLLGPRPGGTAAAGPVDESPQGHRHRENLADAGPPPADARAILGLGGPAPSGAPAVEAPSQAQARAGAALEQLWPALVRKVAWEGDAWRGSMRLELGSGALSGAILLLQCDGGRVRVQLTAPVEADLDSWRARIAARLAAAGLDVAGVD
jgi:hypothetical protein